MAQERMTNTTDLQRLEAILRDMGEPVIVCDDAARIVLFNGAARKMFTGRGVLKLGQSLYRLCARDPVEHGLHMARQRRVERTRYESGRPDTEFVCATADGSLLLHVSVTSVVPGRSGEKVHVFTFRDCTQQVDEMERQGRLLDRMIQGLRAPLANLQAAVENLATFPDMDPEERKRFEEVIIRETGELSSRFEETARESSSLVSQRWPLFDVSSADLISCLAHRFEEEEGVRVTMTGVPLWMRADSYLLLLVLDRFIRLIATTFGVSEVDIEALLGDRRVFLDIVWEGEPLAQSELDALLAESFPEPLAPLTPGDVLARHDSEVWSQRHVREHYSLLRVPVPHSPRQWEESEGEVSPHPEFYDFSPAGITREKIGEEADQDLTTLEYVVFDTETTGLRPDEGDELLALRAVRVVSGRILSGGRFERLIRPSRPLPASSVPFLDLDQEMLRDELSAPEVLSRFRAFVGDGVVVGHNAAFDLRFFRPVEEEYGIRLDRPVLDTLLLALVVDPEQADYTLEGIASRYGVAPVAPRSAMSDCYLCARVLLRLLEMLREQGVRTLGDALDASERVAAQKRQQSR